MLVQSLAASKQPLNLMHVPMDLYRLHIVCARTYGLTSQKTEYVRLQPTLNQRPKILDGKKFARKISKQKRGVSFDGITRSV